MKAPKSLVMMRMLPVATLVLAAAALWAAGDTRVWWMIPALGGVVTLNLAGLAVLTAWMVREGGVVLPIAIRRRTVALVAFGALATCALSAAAIGRDRGLMVAVFLTSSIGGAMLFSRRRG
ncbi:MAG: hypothetical protein M3081_07360 [Gemmatimonadota bacterium]|nr:hypothetical protein [Gemmatimonadota bacterium]